MCTPPVPADVVPFTEWTAEEEDLLAQLAALHTQARRGAALGCVIPRAPYWRMLCMPAWQLNGRHAPQEYSHTHTHIALQANGKIKWSAVAAGMPGRTDKHCASHMKVLLSG